MSQRREVKSLRIFGTRYSSWQLRLFRLEEVPGETGWLKAIKMDEYAPRLSRMQNSGQQALFSHAEAL